MRQEKRITNFIKNYTSKEALVACRSLGWSENVEDDFTNWIQAETCEYKCPDGKKANRKCNDNAMNLAECVTRGFFRYATNIPTAKNMNNKNAGVNLICRECGQKMSMGSNPIPDKSVFCIFFS